MVAAGHRARIGEHGNLRRYESARTGSGLTGDDYLDLVEAIERGAVGGDGGLEPDGLRARYTIRLGSWAIMLGDLLGQLAADAGSTRKALILLGVPADLLGAWVQDPIVGTEATAMWFAARRPETLRRIAILRCVRPLRGDEYLDLADAVGGLAIAGDGALDPARLRDRYTIDRAPWLSMVADLLGQLVADAGSIERASTVLAVPLATLATWVRWLVSRGSPYAASSRWPVAPVGDTPQPAAYLDLAEAVERGALDGDNAIDSPEVADSYTVQLDSWERMEADLLSQVITDAGSGRNAAKVLSVPRSTLGAWMKRTREMKR
ncbi:hypothetical protein [Enhygromyxa salina]|uniref:Uncharacterized protein n=1 Tax=Enhygromyxa salina TaxID=215803 RepID=A0A2S9Y083_9BACT|nr:hypothetical protein [Enhygromyxa salina]PRP98522.1 hypothetical protein ENSA7_64650 [Enhygromyxa salina]